MGIRFSIFPPGLYSAGGQMECIKEYSEQSLATGGATVLPCSCAASRLCQLYIRCIGDQSAQDRKTESGQDPKLLLLSPVRLPKATGARNLAREMPRSGKEKSSVAPTRCA